VIVARDSKSVANADPVRINRDGTYELNRIPPGKYRLFAVSAVDANMADLPPALVESAPEIEVAANQRLTKDVKVISKEAPRGH